MRTKKQLIESAVIKITKKVLREIDDVSDDDWYQGNYADLEGYRKVMARGIITSATSAKDALLKTNLKSQTAMAKCIRYLHKNRVDTVDALDLVLKTYETGIFKP